MLRFPWGQLRYWHLGASTVLRTYLIAKLGTKVLKVEVYLLRAHVETVSEGNMRTDENVIAL